MAGCEVQRFYFTEPVPAGEMDGVLARVENQWRGAMNARKLIEGSVRSPEALKILGKAFDEAWSVVAHKFNGDAQAIEQARVRLAQAVLAVSDGDNADPEEVKAAALQAMPEHPSQPRAP
jgi:hypothetical protein